jgi:hypothetical protein
MEYLGMPIDEKKLDVSQWDPMEIFLPKDSWLERKSSFHWRQRYLGDTCILHHIGIVYSVICINHPLFMHFR